MPNQNPYLSLCVNSRNDNHGGDMYRRMKTCLFGFFEQAERHKLHSEIVLVDWNPPQNRPILKDAYSWPQHSRYCTIRVIVAPPEIHRRYGDWEKIPLYFDVAKNTAIRRARGKFILSSCVDDLLSDELAHFLANQSLSEDKIYLVGRTDVDRKVTRLASLEEKLSYCQKSMIREYSYERTESSGMNGLPDFWKGGPGDFTLMASRLWHRIKGYPEINVWGPATDGVVCYMACLAGATPEFLESPLRLFHIDHGRPNEIQGLDRWIRLQLRRLFPEKWHTRLKTFSHRLFPILSMQAKTHEAQFGSLSIGRSLVVEMIQKKRPFIYNNESWGLAQEVLPEFVVTRAAF